LRLSIRPLHFVRPAAPPETATWDERQVRPHVEHRPVKSPARGRGRGVGPKIIRGGQLEKCQATPRVRLGKIRDVLNRVNSVHGPRDAQPRVQLNVEPCRSLSRGPWRYRKNGQEQHAKEANEGHASCFHVFIYVWSGGY